jgi:hypothetical protein
MTAQNAAENHGEGEGKTRAPKAPSAKDMGELRDGLKMAQATIKSLSKEDKKIVRNLLSELGLGRGSEASEEDEEDEELDFNSPKTMRKVSMLLGRTIAGEKLDRKERKIIDHYSYKIGYHRAGKGFLGFMGELTGISDVKRAFNAKGFNNRAGGAMAAGAKGFGLSFLGWAGYKQIKGLLSGGAE